MSMHSRRSWMIRTYILFGLLLSLILGCSAGNSDRAKAGSDWLIVQRHNDFGVAYMEQHNYYAALLEFQKALDLYPDYVIGRINEGIAYYALSKYTEAEVAFEKTLTLDPKNPYAHFNLGLIYKVQGDYEKARPQFEEVLKVDHEDPYVYYNLGIVLSKLGHHEEAIKAYHRVIELDPNNISAHYNMANELMRMGKREESKKELAIFNEKKKSGINPTVGVRYLEQGKYAEAVMDHTGLSEKETEPPIPVTFVDVTAEAGLDVHSSSTAPSASTTPLSPSTYTLRWAEEHLVPTMGSGVTFGDYDGDGDQDIYIVRCAPSKEPSANVLYRNNGDGTFTDVTEEADVGDTGLGMDAVFGDVDNDGDADLYVANYGPNVLYRNNGDGTFTDITEQAGVAAPGWSMGVAFADVDHEGDLDLYVANYVDLPSSLTGTSARFPDDFPGQINVLYRNNGDGTFTDITEQAGVGNDGNRSTAVLFTDFDNDRDVDFYVVNDLGPNALYSNNRDGTFTNVAERTGVHDNGRGVDIAGGDVDKDSFMDLCIARGADRPNVLVRHTGATTFARKTVGPDQAMATEFVDYDNNGDLDLLFLGPNPMLLRNQGDGSFVSEPKVFKSLRDRKLNISRMALADYDNDGDVDILTVDHRGRPTLLRNDGGNQNHYLKIRLVGTSSNKDGIGSKVEIKTGALWQKAERRGDSASGQELTFGLGKADQVDMVRILWPGGVRQTELGVAANQDTTITEVDRKGTSCPLLYAWNGSQFEFITDFLGMAAAGELERPGVYAYPDVDEYVKIEGAQLKSQDGLYKIRIATQLEEIAFIDQVRLIAVDHPSDVDVYPNEKASFSGAYPAFKIYAVRDRRPPVAAYDDQGNDILPLILKKDRTYPEGFKLLRLQGYAEMHTITLDLGDLSEAEQIILLLNGTLKYAGSNSNLAASQMGLELYPPHLEVINAEGKWETALSDMGIPAGEPKTIPVDLTGKFPTDDYRIRITTNVPIYWDQIQISTSSGSAPVRLTDLTMSRAELRWLGYPRRYSPDGKWPPIYDYHDARTYDLWRDMTGCYTRYGDVQPLLREIDDQFVITRHGDEVALQFDIESTPPLPEGWSRDFLFYANGFGKDTTINSAYSDTVEPLPFHGMSNYPYPEIEHYPDDELHRRYMEIYNTRTIVWKGE